MDNPLLGPGLDHPGGRAVVEYLLTGDVRTAAVRALVVVVVMLLPGR